MRKYLQIIVVISVLSFLVWLRNAKFASDDIPTAGIKANAPLNPISTATPTQAPSQAPTSAAIPTTVSVQKSSVVITPTPIPVTPTPVPTQAGQYKNGTYTGSVQDAFYGNVQVQAVISGGQITDVIFLQYPNDNNTSRNINSQAMPLLKQEAIQAQSANVSGVSGASATSPAFKQSLADALSQAK